MCGQKQRAKELLGGEKRADCNCKTYIIRQKWKMSACAMHLTRRVKHASQPFAVITQAIGHESQGRAAAQHNRMGRAEIGVFFFACPAVPQGGWML